MRFIHLGDTHLGKFDRGKRERFRDNGIAFLQVVEYAIDQGVDFVLHSGDLFDTHRPDADTILQAILVLTKLKENGIPFFVTEGNHDMMKGRLLNSIFHVLAKQNLVRFLYFYDLEDFETSYCDYEVPQTKEKVRIYGLGYLRSGMTNMIGEIAEKINPNTNNIIMLHAGITGTYSHGTDLDSLSPHNISKYFGQNYIYFALGHYHDKAEDPGRRVYQPGSTERWTTGEKLEKFFFDVEWDGSSPPVAKAVPIHIRKTFNKQFEITSWKAGLKDVLAWLESIRGERDEHPLRKKYSDAPIINLHIYGRLKKYFDIQELTSDLEKLYCLYYTFRNDVVLAQFSHDVRKWGELDEKAIKLDILKGALSEVFGTDLESVSEFVLEYIQSVHTFDIIKSRQYQDLRKEQRDELREFQQKLRKYRQENSEVFNSPSQNVQK